jgi:hypothetical protein
MTEYPLTWLADVLRDAGCRVVEESGWKTRGRPASSGSFKPRALLRHWDASSKGSHGAISTVINGNGDTPGPLCSILTCRGNDSHGPSVHVIAAGRTNHGGTGDAWGVIPKDDANTYAVGHEIAHTTDESWTSDQMTQVRLAEAAILSRLKAQPSDALPCHAEYAPDRKVDTTGGKYGQDMKSERSAVADVMGGDTMGDLTNVSKALEKVVPAGTETYAEWQTISDDPTGDFGNASFAASQPYTFDTEVYLWISAPCSVRLGRWVKDDKSGQYELAGTFGIVTVIPPESGGYAHVGASGDLHKSDRLRVSIIARDADVTMKNGRWTIRTQPN